MPRIVKAQFPAPGPNRRWNVFLDGRTREFDVNTELDGELRRFVARARQAARRRRLGLSIRVRDGKLRMVAVAARRAPR